MGKTNSKHNLALNTQNEKEEEFQIIKNNIVYNIRLFLKGRDASQKLKIYISFVSNNVFQIYEANLEKEIWNIKNLHEIYQNLSSIIKLEQFEIYYKNLNGIFSLLLTAEINSEKETKNFEKFVGKILYWENYESGSAAIKIDKTQVLQVICHLLSGWGALFFISQLKNSLGINGLILLIIGIILIKTMI